MSQWTRGDKIGLWSLLVAVLSCPFLYQILQGNGLFARPSLSQRETPPQDPGEEAQRRLNEAQEAMLEEQRKNLEEEAKAAREKTRRIRDQRIKERKEHSAEIARQLQLSSGSNYYKIRLHNKCDEELLIAVRFLDLDGVWVTEGWWSREPGEARRINVTTRNRYVYFFAKNSNGSRTWNGEGEAGSNTLFVAKRQFYVTGEEKPLDEDEPREEVFFKRDLGDEWGDYTQGFTCKED